MSGIVDNFEHQDFEQDVVNEYGLIQRKLRACISFWEDTVEASDFVLDIIEHGYKILFYQTPLRYSIKNESSALPRGLISELLFRGCIESAPDLTLIFAINTRCWQFNKQGLEL